MPMPTFPLPAECGRVENEADKDDPIDIWLFRYEANRETIDYESEYASCELSRFQAKGIELIRL